MCTGGYDTLATSMNTCYNATCILNKTGFNPTSHRRTKHDHENDTLSSLTVSYHIALKIIVRY